MGAVDALDGGGFGLLGSRGFLLGPVQLAGGVDDLACDVLAGLLDVAQCAGLCMVDLGSGVGGELVREVRRAQDDQQERRERDA